jgi:restriction endonuclease S subunit
MALLEGLEVSETNFTSIKNETEYLRFDSEFQLSVYRDILHQIEKKPFELLGDLIELLTDGKHGGVTETDSGVIFLRTTNIKPNKIDLSDLRFVSESESSETKRAEVEAGDLLLTTIGTVGDCVVVPKGLGKATINQNLVRIVLKEKNTSSFLCAFLNSKYGKFQTLRWAAGNVYQMINYPNLRLLKVPNFSVELVVQIQSIYDFARELDVKSTANYTHAEALLLETLGMADFTPSSEAVNIKSFKDSFVASGRLDAEYYQPKYDYLEDVFNQFDRVRLADLVNHPICSGTTPKANGDDYSDAEHGVPFVRAVDLQGGLVSLDNLNYIKPDVHNGVLKRTQLMKNDFLFSIAGTVGRCSVFEHDIAANINQAVAILRFDDALINRYCLMVFFNSPIGKALVEKHARQGVQTNLNLTELGDLSIPILEMDTQRQIADLVQHSFALKAQSTHLLEVAKRAVEVAIEQDEAAALAYITREG